MWTLTIYETCTWINVIPQGIIQYSVSRVTNQQIDIHWILTRSKNHTDSTTINYATLCTASNIPANVWKLNWSEYDFNSTTMGDASSYRNCKILPNVVKRLNTDKMRLAFRLCNIVYKESNLASTARILTRWGSLWSHCLARWPWKEWSSPELPFCVKGDPAVLCALSGLGHTKENCPQVVTSLWYPR